MVYFSQLETSLFMKFVRKRGSADISIEESKGHSGNLGGD